MICLLNIAEQFLKHNKTPCPVQSADKNANMRIFVLHTSIKRDQYGGMSLDSKAPGAKPGVFVFLFFTFCNIIAHPAELVFYEVSRHHTCL